MSCDAEFTVPVLLLLVPPGMTWPRRPLLQAISGVALTFDPSAPVQVRRSAAEQPGLTLTFQGTWTCARHEVWTAVSTLVSTYGVPHGPS
ncbi:hypothetical protein LAJ19_21490 (plasmid) [Deinococcus taeanensis]|uniref:hypothetical protein n=1 Tax=Deinococcus taeanensis TaxID=2737050 RepID=UPI001CDB5120|nr:hypothetical protein [Deinococcus taeanensis]UBV45559.1 hypothetical protein LAJ19_21490 [Deinococcus taeanensis]